MRDSHDRLRQAQEDAEMVNRRREEVEQRLGTLEAEYEELLGELPSILDHLELGLLSTY